MSGRLWHWAPALAHMALIFALSAIPDLTRLPGDLSDHAGHFVGYAVLGALVIRACAGAEWAGVTAGAAGAAWLVAAGYGVADEFHQHFVAGRTPAFDDWLADATGAGLAVLVIVVGAIGQRRREPEV
jgi:VanZ family protein